MGHTAEKEVKKVEAEHHRCSGGKWKAWSRTYGVQGRDNVCVYHNMSAKKKEKENQKKKWHRSRITDGGLTQSSLTSHFHTL